MSINGLGSTFPYGQLLDLSGSTLFLTPGGNYSAVSLSGVGGNPATWSQYPALQQVEYQNQNLNNVGVLICADSYSSNLYIGDPINNVNVGTALTTVINDLGTITTQVSDLSGSVSTIQQKTAGIFQYEPEWLRTTFNNPSMPITYQSGVKSHGFLWATADVIAYADASQPVSLINTAEKINAFPDAGLRNLLQIIPTSTNQNTTTVVYTSLPSPSSYVPDQTAPVAGINNGWRYSKAPGSTSGTKINWTMFNPYFPTGPSIGVPPSPLIPRSSLQGVWAVITTSLNLATQGALFFNIFTYDYVNGSSTYFTNRWDYCANSLALPLTTGAMTLQSGFRYLIYCLDAPKIVATPGTSTTITQANGQYPTQTNAQKLKNPYDIYTEVDHVGFGAVALNTTPTPQPSNPMNVPISAIVLSTTSSTLTNGIDITVESFGFIGNNGGINEKFILQYT